MKTNFFAYLVKIYFDLFLNVREECVSLTSIEINNVMIIFILKLGYLKTYHRRQCVKFKRLNGFYMI